MIAQENLRKLADLIQGIKVAMLTTTADDGTLRSRPMVTLDAEFDGTLWFFTQAGAPKVAQVAHEGQVNVSYANPERQRYVSVCGAARLVEDRRRIKELWRPALKTWFPNGPDGADLALLRVDAESAEYWDGPSSAVIRLADLARPTPS
jgi:general stress protein 26